MPEKDLRAFALRADVGEISGATQGYADGKTFDIKKAIDDASDGVIVVDATKDTELAELLAGNPILKTVSAPDGAPKRSTSDKAGS